MCCLFVRIVVALAVAPAPSTLAAVVAAHISVGFVDVFVSVYLIDPVSSWRASAVVDVSA